MYFGRNSGILDESMRELLECILKVALEDLPIPVSGVILGIIKEGMPQSNN